MDCIFCKKEQFEDNIISESEHSYCLMDEYPATEGHCLIISKDHYSTLEGMPDDVYLMMMKHLKESISLLQRLYPRTDYNVVYCEGHHAGQGISHVHWHLVLREENDGVVIDLNETLSSETYKNNKRNFINTLKEGVSMK